MHDKKWTVFSVGVKKLKELYICQKVNSVYIQVKKNQGF